MRKDLDTAEIVRIFTVFEWFEQSKLKNKGYVTKF